jgi:hypothetical protein
MFTEPAQPAALPRPVEMPAAFAPDAQRRLLGAVAATIAAALLGVAAWLRPADDGIGTHMQLALPGCQWVTIMDLPCPTCGMTTAFAHAADGHLLASVRAQPFGALLAIAAAMTLIAGAYVALTGSALASLLPRLWGRRAGWLLAAAVMLAWAYKMLSYKGILP